MRVLFSIVDSSLLVLTSMILYIIFFVEIKLVNEMFSLILYSHYIQGIVIRHVYTLFN